MTAKEKAIELHDKYYKIFEELGLDNLPNKYAKEHAKICVKELQEEGSNYIKYTSHNMARYAFYDEVLREIELL
tara:strand:- start:139 stop:360 length:222 start_codon:yes stop_codon:yes gene_type:complete